MTGIEEEEKVILYRIVINRVVLFLKIASIVNVLVFLNCLWFQISYIFILSPIYSLYRGRWSRSLHLVQLSFVRQNKKVVW